jgi:hypothetical protein
MEEHQSLLGLVYDSILAPDPAILSPIFVIFKQKYICFKKDMLPAPTNSRLGGSFAFQILLYLVKMLRCPLQDP